MTPRTSWGSWKVLGELWEVSGGPRVGFRTFWGDQGASLGGVQSSLLGGKYITNTEVLEFGRFSVTCRCLWVLFVFSTFLLSLIFVNQGGEFVVKQTKNEGFEFEEVRNFQYKYDEKVGSGG